MKRIFIILVALVLMSIPVYSADMIFMEYEGLGVWGFTPGDTVIGQINATDPIHSHVENGELYVFFADYGFYQYLKVSNTWLRIGDLWPEKWSNENNYSVQINNFLMGLAGVVCASMFWGVILKCV